MSFVNFATVSDDDRAFLRFYGEQNPEGDNPSGWICRNQTLLEVIWAPDPPPNAVLWSLRVVTPPTPTATGTLTATTEGLSLVASGSTVQLQQTSNPVPWRLSRFSGYSNNQVPGRGWEPHAFTVQVGSLFLTKDPLSARVVLNAEPTPCTFLYWDGPRDADLLNSENQVCFSVRTVPQGQWLTWSALQSFGSQRAVAVTDRVENAALLQVKSLITTDTQVRFSLVLVASSWVLGTDDNQRLVFGEAGGDTSAVTSTTVVVPLSQFKFNTPQRWSVLQGSGVFRVTSEFLLDPFTLEEQEFEFVLNSDKRLHLGFTDILQGHVGVYIPKIFQNKAIFDPKENGIKPLQGYIVARKKDPGCVSFVDYDLNWFPEVIPENDIPIALGGCYLRWTSGNPDTPEGNVFFVSAHVPTGSFQVVQTLLLTYPMQSQSMCFIDSVNGEIPPNCGAVQLMPFESNLGALPVEVFRNYFPPCMDFVQDVFNNAGHEGYVAFFTRDQNPSGGCGFPSILMASSEWDMFLARELVAVAVPENLSVQIHVDNNGPRVTLGPGTYSAETLRLINPEWPLGLRASFWVYVSTVNPQILHVAKTCAGFAGSESRAWVPGRNPCNQFMEEQCKRNLLNSAVCGCFQDIKWIQTLGLDTNTTLGMVTSPQCFGPTCALGSAYKKDEWKDPCNVICRQIINGQGDNFVQKGVQTLTCGGDIYNFAKSDLPVVTKTEVPVKMVVAVSVVGTTALVFLVLFLVYRYKK